MRGPLGTFSGSTLQVVTGYSGKCSYDGRLAAHPPAFFPATGSSEGTPYFCR